ncbi:MAG: SLC26A/SulP transporter family protein, partial [Acetobacteraceae bacterium]|nr:SLC26A/SulP transporter family protein [Acetobacteraceae bacterium]
MALRAPRSGIAPAINALLPHRRTRDKPASSTVRALTVGFVGALWAILNVIAYAGLIFSGPLTPALLTATSAMLGGYAVVALVIALGSRVPGMVTTSLSSSAVVYAAAVSGLDQQLVRAGLDDAMARAGLALLLCGWTTVIGGVALWLVGALRAGAAARLLPFPVIEGYHAGLGGLFIAGGISVATGLAPRLVIVDALDRPLVLAQAGACLALGLLILYLSQRLRYWWAIPGLLVASTLLFHALCVGWHADVGAARAAGWLLGPFPHSAAPPVLSAFSPSSLSLVSWKALYAWAPYLASNTALLVIALMLTVTGLELDLRRAIDVDAELKTAGIGNVLGGALGGLPSCHGLAATMLLQREGAASRFGALLPAFGALAVLLAGMQALELVPRFVFGALLLCFGVERLFVRLGKDCVTLPRHEAAIALAVAGCTLWLGVVDGLLIGIALAILLFAWSYRHVPIIRASLPGSACRSSVVRSPEAIGVLDREAESILLQRLQGYLFFLNATALPAAVSKHVASGARLRFLVIDFRDVVGMDSSAHGAFERVEQLASEQGFQVLLASIGPALATQFHRRGTHERPSQRAQLFDTVDHALQHVENRILADAAVDSADAPLSLARQLEVSVGTPVAEARLEPYLEHVALRAGMLLIRQGESADAMYFIERGSVSARIGQPGGAFLRLRTTTAGALVGEIAIYRGGMRTASVVAEEDSVVTRLSTSALARIERDDPDLAALLHRFLIVQ